MCVSVSVSVPVSLASDSSETLEVMIIVKLDNGDCLRHENASHINYIDLDLNHENSKCLII